MPSETIDFLTIGKQEYTFLKYVGKGKAVPKACQQESRWLSPPTPTPWQVHFGAICEKESSGGSPETGTVTRISYSNSEPVFHVQFGALASPAAPEAEFDLTEVLALIGRARGSAGGGGTAK